MYIFEGSRVGLVVWLSGSARMHTPGPGFHPRHQQPKARRFCVYVAQPYLCVKTHLIRKVLCMTTLGR